MGADKNYQYDFRSRKPADEIFLVLQDVKSWWSGLFGENITGDSTTIGDEFSFSAGHGAHFSKQKLIEIKPNKELVWLVIESNLSFLNDTQEWENTRIIFNLEGTAHGTKITFIHAGLVPNIECYKNCTDAWTQYLEKLEKALNS